MNLKRTGLYESCLANGARMVSFADWELPLQFSGLLNEHKAVREEAGIFDISHMGAMILEGENLKDAFQSLVPSDLHRIGYGEACYTVLTNEAGGIIDDLIIYDITKESDHKESLLLIINASRTLIDIEWIKKHLKFKNFSISDAKENHVLLALQGPKSQEIIRNTWGSAYANIPKFGHKIIEINKSKNLTDSIFIARTGYTGEDGFELLMPIREGRLIWDKLIKEGITPCGLGARDTLRLEAAMPLYGKDLQTTTTPLEAGLGWLIHLEIPKHFIGREAIEKEIQKGSQRRLIGLQIKGRAIGRDGYAVFEQGQKIGTITSGSWSPTLQKAIALAYVPTKFAKIGQNLQVEVRGEKHNAEIVKKPFYKRTS